MGDPLQLHELLELSPEFRCPISQEPFEDPVVASDGHTYERFEIERWFATGKQTSPMTNSFMPDRRLIPNHVVRSFLKEHKARVERWETKIELLQDLLPDFVEDKGPSGTASSGPASSGLTLIAPKLEMTNKIMEEILEPFLQKAVMQDATSASREWPGANAGQSFREVLGPVNPLIVLPKMPPIPRMQSPGAPAAGPAHAAPQPWQQTPVAHQGAPAPAMTGVPGAQRNQGWQVYPMMCPPLMIGGDQQGLFTAPAGPRQQGGSSGSAAAAAAQAPMPKRGGLPPQAGSSSFVKGLNLEPMRAVGSNPRRGNS